jgi:hypothetical protein
MGGKGAAGGLDDPFCRLRTVVISHDSMFLDRMAIQCSPFEGDVHVEWFKDNFEEYEGEGRVGWNRKHWCRAA